MGKRGFFYDHPTPKLDWSWMLTAQLYLNLVSFPITALFLGSKVHCIPLSCLVSNPTLLRLWLWLLASCIFCGYRMEYLWKRNALYMNDFIMFICQVFQFGRWTWSEQISCECFIHPSSHRVMVTNTRQIQRTRPRCGTPVGSTVDCCSTFWYIEQTENSTR